MTGEEDIAVTNFKITRRLPMGKYKLGDVFSGLEYSPPLRKIFADGNELHKLWRLDVEITEDAKYMRVSDHDGRLLINPSYLKRGRKEFIYLDLIHELTHVIQFRQGNDIYDQKYRYIDRPTELEAFTNAVAEARRIGLSDLEIYEYLKVDWISELEHQELAKRLGILTI